MLARAKFLENINKERKDSWQDCSRKRNKIQINIEFRAERGINGWKIAMNRREHF